MCDTKKNEPQKYESFDVHVDDEENLFMSYSGSLVILTKDEYNKIKPDEHIVTHGGTAWKFQAYCVAMRIAGMKRNAIQLEVENLGYTYKLNGMLRNINRAYQLKSQEDADRFVDLFKSYPEIFIKYGVYRADVMNYIISHGLEYKDIIQKGQIKEKRCSKQVFNAEYSNENEQFLADSVSYIGQKYFYEEPDIVIMPKRKYEELSKKVISTNNDLQNYTKALNQCLEDYSTRMHDLDRREKELTQNDEFKQMYESERQKNEALNKSLQEKNLALGELKGSIKVLEGQLLKERETVEKTNVILGYLAACVTGSGHAHYLKGFIKGSICSGHTSQELKEQVSPYLDDIIGVPKLVENAINECEKILENK